MGPRHNAAENMRRPTRSVSPAGFNGAAAQRRGKQPSHRSRPASSPRFNGAAAQRRGKRYPEETLGASS